VSNTNSRAIGALERGQRIYVTFDLDFTDHVTDTPIDEMERAFPIIQEVLLKRPSLRQPGLSESIRRSRAFTVRRLFFSNVMLGRFSG
jgi:hypothetical protein